MEIHKILKSRPGAKFINDVDIPDSSWKADFDIADRYQNYANELMRIALLGLAGYGYLISEICIKNKDFYPILKVLTSYLLIGATFLGLSVILILAHRFFSTECLNQQILIMRSLKRLENSHWTLEEKENEKIVLKNAREKQTKVSKISHYLLKSAAVCFALGFLFVIVVFYIFLESLP